MWEAMLSYRANITYLWKHDKEKCYQDSEDKLYSGLSEGKTMLLKNNSYQKIKK